MTAEADADDRPDAQDQQGRNQQGGDKLEHQEAQHQQGADQVNSDASDNSDGAADGASDEQGMDRRHDPEYLDRDALDFDPDDGLYTGTAVEGNSEIPGPHENQDDTTDDSSQNENGRSADGGSGVDASDGGSGDGAAEGRESERVEQSS